MNRRACGDRSTPRAGMPSTWVGSTPTLRQVCDWVGARWAFRWAPAAPSPCRWLSRRSTARPTWAWCHRVTRALSEPRWFRQVGLRKAGPGRYEAMIQDPRRAARHPSVRGDRRRPSGHRCPVMARRSPCSTTSGWTSLSDGRPTRNGAGSRSTPIVRHHRGHQHPPDRTIDCTIDHTIRMGSCGPTSSEPRPASSHTSRALRACHVWRSAEGRTWTDTGVLGDDDGEPPGVRDFGAVPGLVVSRGWPQGVGVRRWQDMARGP